MSRVGELRTARDVWVESGAILFESEYVCVLEIFSRSTGMPAVAKITTDERAHREERDLLGVFSDVRNIVRLLDSGETTFDGVRAYFLVLERLREVCLLNLDPDRYGKLGMDLVDALQGMHDKGYIHNDIAPCNIGLRDDGSAVLFDLDMCCRIGVGSIPGRWQFAAWKRYHLSKAAYDFESLLYSMLFSVEGGLPWDGTESIAVRAKKREGLPLFVRTRSGRLIVAAIHDAKLSEDTQEIVRATFYRMHQQDQDSSGVAATTSDASALSPAPAPAPASAPAPTSDLTPSPASDAWQAR